MKLLFCLAWLPCKRIGNHLAEQTARRALRGLRAYLVVAADDGRSAQNWNFSRFQDSVTHSRAAVTAAGLVHFLHHGLKFCQQLRVHRGTSGVVDSRRWRTGRMLDWRIPRKGFDVWR